MPHSVLAKKRKQLCPKQRVFVMMLSRKEREARKGMKEATPSLLSHSPVSTLILFSSF